MLAQSPLLLLLLAELVVLQRGQRQLFWRLGGGGALRPLAYLAVMPGTILHESSHVLACRALAVPVGRTRLFGPRRLPDGSMLLGSVSRGRTGPIRGALISAAPLVLVPAALTGASAALLGPHVLLHLSHGLRSVPAWRLALWGWLSLSCAQATFPSSGDHIGLLGAVLLGLVLGTGLLALSVAGGVTALHGALVLTAALLALPAAVSAVTLAVLRRR